MEISTTTSTILAAAFLLGMALFGLAMLVLVLRLGPARGFLNQPAAALRKPGGTLVVALYVLAVLHVLAGISIVVAVPGSGIGIIFVNAAMAGFYVLCANAYSLARSASRRRSTASSDPS